MDYTVFMPVLIAFAFSAIMGPIDHSGTAEN